MSPLQAPGRLLGRFLLGAILLGVFATLTSAAPVLDGTRDVSYSLRAVQSVETGFGDNVSELDAAYAQIDGGKLYLMLTGNLENNFNKLNIFIDSVPGGQNRIGPATDEGGANPNNDDWAENYSGVGPSAWASGPGFTFDAGFTADYLIILRNGFIGDARFDVDYAIVGGGAGGFESAQNVFSGSLTGSNANALPSRGIGVAFNNNNTGGVLGGFGAAKRAAARAVLTGIEIAIPLSALGNPDPKNILVSAHLNGYNHDFLSNQSLPGFAPQQGNPGGDNFGNWSNDVAQINLNNYAYNQFFSVQPPPPPAPAKHNYTPIDYPAATATFANGIGPLGNIVGEYTDVGGTTHAFIRSAQGAYSSFDVPGAVGYSSANGINSSGQVVGLYKVGDGSTHAYRRTANSYVELTPTFGVPGFTQAVSINEAGHVVGSVFVAPEIPHGFFFDGTTYTELSAPNAQLTVALGINNAGSIVGNAVIGNVSHGFLFEAGYYTILDVPGADFTIAEGINDAGQITGLYGDATGEHGYTFENGGYVPFDYPGASVTAGFGINNAATVVGYYEDDVGSGHGLLATPLAAADFNMDGQVNGVDLAAWRAGFGLATGGTKPTGDANGDFAVDGADFLKWQTQLTIAGAASPAATHVPEPAAWGLAVASVGGLATSARRRTSCDWPRRAATA